MRRRDFLKLVGAIPFAGLAVKEKSALVVEHKTLEDFRDAVRERLSVEHDRPIGIALEDIPKGGYGWVQLGMNGDDFAVKQLSLKEMMRNT